MRPILTWAFALASAAALSGQTAAPAQPAPTQPVFRSGIGVVRVDVTVMDRRGLPVPGLTAEDFEVREQGVAQKIEWLQYVQVTGTPAPGDDMSLEIRSPDHAAQEAARDDVRLLVIFLDDYHLRNGPGFDVRLRDLLKGFVRAEMQPTDLFAVMGPLTPISDLKLTRNKQDIIDRIAKFQGRLGGFMSPRSPIEESQFLLDPAMRREVRAQVSLSALKSLAVHLGSLRDGRASILFVSEGPPMFAGGTNNSNELRDVITAANTSNVTIHTLDPRALSVGPRFSSDVNGSLAADTGGRELSNSNDNSRGLASVISDSSAYYLLGYTPERDVADGKFHKIDVRVRGKSMRVLSRRGYWAPNAAEMRPSAPAVAVPTEIGEAFGALTEALRPRTGADWIGLDPSEGGQSHATVACELASATPKNRLAARLAVQVVKQDGTVIGEYAGERPAPDAPWITRFRVAPGPLTVRFVIRNAADTTLESWTRAIVVPEESEPGGRVGTPIVYRPTTAAAHRDVLAGGTLPPLVERRFRRTDRVLVRLPLAVDARGATVRAELINEGGRTLVALPVVTDAAGSRLVELPLANLAQAKYALRLSVTWEAGAVSRLVPFAVTP